MIELRAEEKKSWDPEVELKRLQRWRPVDDRDRQEPECELGRSIGELEKMVAARGGGKKEKGKAPVAKAKAKAKPKPKSGKK